MKSCWSSVAFLVLATASTAAWGVPANLAPAGVASGSSEGFGSVYGDAIDGNRNGAFGAGSVWHANGHPEVNPPTYYQVDLDGDYYLDRLEIFPRTDANQNSVRNFRVTVLDSANVQVFSQDYFTGVNQATNDVPWGTNALRNVYGKTVRIQRLSQDPVPLSFMTFAEFEIYGQSTPILPNLAASGTVTATTGGGFGTSLLDAIDGDIDGHYGHTDGVASSHPMFHADTNLGTEYWQVDLGGVYDLDYVNLFNRTDFAGNTSSVRLDILAADGTTVVDTRNLSLQGTDFGGRRYDLTIDLDNVPGQFVRVTALEGGGDRFLTFAEVEAFGTVHVPEPSTLVLVAIGGGIALAACRRRGN